MPSKSIHTIFGNLIDIKISKSLHDITCISSVLTYIFISIPFLMIRELVQFFISDSKLGYFKKRSNQLELMLIFANCTLLTFIYDGQYRISAAIIILFSFIEILMLLPTSTLSSYMFMLKTVSATFIKFFWIFLVIILAFTFSFYSLFRPIVDKLVFKHESDYEYDYDHHDNHTIYETVDQCNRTERKNFGGIVDSFLKTTLMIAGNMTIEPRMLNSFWEKVICFMFLITAMVLLNLINGLAISDIQVCKFYLNF